MIDGFTIGQSNGYTGISISNASPIISNNIIYRQTGILIHGNSKPIIRNNVFHTNSSGILVSGEEALDMLVTIQNNTITSNTTTGKGIYLTNANPFTRIYSLNNIIANNDIGVTDRNTLDTQHQHIFSSFNTYWNDVSGNFGDGIYKKLEAGDNIEDPMFVDATKDAFHLQSGSPCINSGNPDKRYNRASAPVIIIFRFFP